MREERSVFFGREEEEKDRQTRETKVFRSLQPLALKGPDL